MLQGHQKADEPLAALSLKIIHATENVEFSSQQQNLIIQRYCGFNLFQGTNPVILSCLILKIPHSFICSNFDLPQSQNFATHKDFFLFFFFEMSSENDLVIQHTKNLYEYSEVLSLVQKGLRRHEEQMVMFFTFELIQSGFSRVLWHRLLVIAVEDVIFGTYSKTYLFLDIRGITS